MHLFAMILSNFKDIKTCLTAELHKRLPYRCRLAFSPVPPQCKPAKANIGFVSKSYFKVGCFNLLAIGLVKPSSLFRSQPPSTEGISTRLISVGSLEVPSLDVGLG